MSRFVDRSETSIYRISFRRQTIELASTTHRAIFSRVSMKLTRRESCLRIARISSFFSSRSLSRCFMSFFSERELFEFTSRDEHHSRRSQSRWASEWESYSQQHRKSNQSEIDQSWRSDRQIYDRRTTRQETFKVAQRLQIDRSTSKTHLRADFIVKNLKQRWQHFEFFFLSRTIFSVFERERSSLIMLREREDLHTDDMIKSFKSFWKIEIDEWIAEDAWARSRKRSNLLSRELFNVSSSSCLRLTFAFINHCLQHFSFMKDDRFRWISERISRTTRSRLWIDRSDRLRD